MDKSSESQSDKRSILIVSAEASSEPYAIRLINELKKKQKGRSLEFFGVGSQKMEDLGFERFGASEEMAVVGIVEAAQQYNIIKAAFEALISRCDEKKPHVAILMGLSRIQFKACKRT